MKAYMHANVHCSTVLNREDMEVSNVSVQIKKICSTDFPGGPVVKNPPDSAGAMGSDPRSGRFHMPWSNCAHRTQVLKPAGPGACSANSRNEQLSHFLTLGCSSCSQQPEKARAQQQGPAQPEINA